MSSLHQKLIDNGYEVVSIIRKGITKKDEGIYPLAIEISGTSLRINSKEYLDLAVLDAELALSGDEKYTDFVPSEPATLIYALINWKHERYKNLEEPTVFLPGMLNSKDGRMLSFGYSKKSAKKAKNI